MATPARQRLFAIGEAGLLGASTVLEFTLLADWMPLMACLAASALACVLFLDWRNRQAVFAPTDWVQPRRLFKDFQALLLLQTSVAILAVDFPAMPRRLAKTESSGVSPMDLGAPVFAFTGGLFAAVIPETAPSRFHGNAASPWRRSLRAALPLAVLGLARTLAVKATAYQEHVTEYGVHWNFFLTLACLRLAWPPASGHPALWAACAALGHVCCLLPWGVAEFLTLRPEALRVRAPDTPLWWWLLAANREGLLSLPPYMSLYCAGAAMAGCLATALSPEQRKRRDRPSLWLIVSLLAAGAFVPPVLAAHDLLPLAPPSRRLFNAAFLLVCLSACCLVLLLLLLLGRGARRGQDFLGSLGSAALPFFLLSNLLTGAVNFAVDTVRVTDNPTAAAIVAAYLACLLACLPAAAALAGAMEKWRLR